jgi:hypothetical protein
MKWLKFSGMFVLSICLFSCNLQQNSNNINLYSAKTKIDSLMADKIKFIDAAPLLLRVNLQSYDTKIGEANALISVDIPPQWVGPSYALTHNLTLIDEYNIDDSVMTIKAGDPYQVYNAYLKSRYEVSQAGDQFLYPFDKHDVRINLFAISNNDKQERQIPLIYDCELCSFEGYDLKITDMQTKGHVDLKVTIARNIATILCAVLLNLAFIIMGLVVFVMALRIVRDHESPDMGAIGFIGSLMFAFPVLRQVLPDSPPLGILLDLVGLFPSELLIVLSLLIVIICWLIRGKAHHNNGGEITTP